MWWAQAHPSTESKAVGIIVDTVLVCFMRSDGGHHKHWPSNTHIHGIKVIPFFVVVMKWFQCFWTQSCCVLTMHMHFCHYVWWVSLSLETFQLHGCGRVCIDKFICSTLQWSSSLMGHITATDTTCWATKLGNCYIYIIFFKWRVRVFFQVAITLAYHNMRDIFIIRYLVILPYCWLVVSVW